MENKSAPIIRSRTRANPFLDGYRDQWNPARPLAHYRVRALFAERVISAEEAARLITSSLDVPRTPWWVFAVAALVLGFVLGESRIHEMVASVKCGP